MFNKSSHFGVSGDAISIVGGTHCQYITNHNYSESSTRTPQFSLEDEWKMVLYQEYDRVRTGNVNLLREIGESRVGPYEHEEWTMADEWVRKKTWDAKRVFSVARLHTGKGKSRCLGVAYTGPDANKLFKQDCIQFLSFKHAAIAQLCAFNDSVHPMIFFHEELIPLRDIFLRHPGCRVALEQYIPLQRNSILDLPRFDLRNQSWIRAQDGAFIVGPIGPEIEYHEARFIYPPKRDIFRNWHSIQPLSPNLYDNANLVKYLATWLQIPSGFIPPQSSSTYGNLPLPSSANLAIICSSSASGIIIGKFPEFGGPITWRLGGLDKISFRSIMDDGKIQIDHVPWHSRDFLLSFRFYLCPSDRERISCMWLAQACHVFHKFNIPRDDWNKYGYVSWIEVQLEAHFMEPQGIIPFHSDDMENNLPCYIFVHPVMRCSNGWPNLLSWTSGENSHYWSTDLSGRTVMTEQERQARGLPTYIPRVITQRQFWNPEDYDFMHDFQKAKGFDPTTTNFAQSLGYPILEIADDREHIEIGSFVDTWAPKSAYERKLLNDLDLLAEDFNNEFYPSVNRYHFWDEATDDFEDEDSVDVDIEDLCSRFERLGLSADDETE